jgi:hypothetical protein
VPELSYAIAIELGSVYLQQASSYSKFHRSIGFMHAIDAQSQEEALNALELSNAQSILLYVDINRVPDRGWLSFIKKCQMKSTAEQYLILLGSDALSKNEHLQTRLEDWLEMSAQVNIRAEQVTYLANKEVNHE